MPCSTNTVGLTRNFGGYLFLFLFYISFLYFGNVFNKTIIPHGLVGYDIFTANSALRASLAIYPTRVRGITVKYPTLPRETF